MSNIASLLFAPSVDCLGINSVEALFSLLAREKMSVVRGKSGIFLCLCVTRNLQDKALHFTS